MLPVSSGVVATAVADAPAVLVVVIAGVFDLAVATDLERLPRRDGDGLSHGFLLRADAGAIHGLLAADVVAFVVVDVVDGVHRALALLVALVGELAGLVLRVAVLDDTVLVGEQIDIDDTRLAGGDVASQFGHLLCLLQVGNVRLARHNSRQNPAFILAYG